MRFFTGRFVPQLLSAASGADDRGYSFLVLPVGAAPPAEGVDLPQALSDAQLAATFVFATVDPGLTADNAQEFVHQINQIVYSRGVRRAFLWLRKPLDSSSNKTVSFDNPPLFGLSDDGSTISTGLANAQLTTSLELQIQAGMQLALLPAPDATVLGLGGALIRFAGPAAPDTSLVSAGSIAFDGPQRGCLRFDVGISRQSLNDRLHWGFQFLFPVADAVQPSASLWAPLADTLVGPSDQLGFHAAIDPADPTNAGAADRTFFRFSGQNVDGEATKLASWYRTPGGAPIALLPVGDGATAGARPARLVIDRGERTAPGAENFHFAPDGDFILQLADAAASAADGATQRLLCGMQGTESLTFRPKSAGYAGDVLRFTSRRPAHAPRFPFAVASPVAAPVDPAAPLLDDRYLTSWASIQPSSAQGATPIYVAQPRGSALHGHDALLSPRYQNLLGWIDVGNQLGSDPALAFPMIPMAGVTPGNGATTFSKAQIESFDLQVIGPQRRAIVGAVPAARRAGLAAEPPMSVTTPSGLIATLDGTTGGWRKILLGQNLTPEPATSLYFQEPDAQLRQAFQTNQLLLVAANHVHLGELGGTSGAAFANGMSVEGWSMAADVGVANRYNDYRSVLIVKGRKGKLYDPSGPPELNLIANPEGWTQRGDFAPTTSDPATPDPTQLIVLSQWLRDYFQSAAEQTDSSYFTQFNRIATDEDWTGILILKARVAELPPELTGLLAGIEAPDQFYFHHFAIAVSQVQNDPGSATGVQIRDSSSVYGLIYYVDPAVDPLAPDRPLQPDPGAVFDFRVLTLKVLFENTAIRSFQSYAQLSLNQILSTPVLRMGDGGNPFNAIVLRGSYQNNNGQPVYSMGTTQDTTFYLDSNVINKVEVTSAQMSTRDAGLAGDARSWFALNGFLDFRVVQPSATQAYDLFSFGAGADDPTRLGQGLSFGNLGVELRFPLRDPRARTLSLSTNEITFDVSTSTPRAGSLFRDFALELGGLIGGDGDTTIDSLGYLPVITDFGLGGATGQWYGLRFRLNLGSPGELAGKISLASYLVLAWSPTSRGDGDYAAAVGLQLPGTGGGANLISLQNVLKLAIGQVRLTSDPDKKSYLLMLLDIALRFLGLLKLPPSGSTAFYLFGNPETGADPTGLGWYALYRGKQA